jgi:hypothetical protein
MDSKLRASVLGINHLRCSVTLSNVSVVPNSPIYVVGKKNYYPQKVTELVLKHLEQKWK